MERAYLERMNQRKQAEIASILKCNEYTAKYGMVLSDKQITRLLERKSEVLKETGRVELRGGVVEKLIKEFCDSVYMDQENLEANLYELIEMFYEAKNETMELLTDDELIQFMRKAFDEICHGDLDYLSGWVRNRLRENLQNGKSMEECMKAWKEEYE